MWKVKKYYGSLPFSTFLTDCDARFIRKVEDESIDCIVTSPPYANAQEYFRSVKLELFWLGFADEEKLRKLNRELIGTEKIDSDESKKLHQTGISELDSAIAQIYTQDKRRSAIVWRYFGDIKQNFRECFRVLKPGRHFAILVGDNVIRKVPVTTHKYLIEIGEDIGFKLVDVGYDKIVARSLSPKRNKSGGLIDVEWMLIFQKP